MINRRTTYGIRALTSIARASPCRLSVAELAKSEGIPSKFLASILLYLARYGIVRGHRGRVGGYELAMDPSAVTVAEVLESLGGPIFRVLCLRGEPGHRPVRCAECPAAGRCPAELAPRSAAAEVHRVLSSISHLDLVHAVDETETAREAPRAFAALGRERRQGGSRLR